MRKDKMHACILFLALSSVGYAHEMRKTMLLAIFACAGARAEPAEQQVKLLPAAIGRMEAKQVYATGAPIRRPTWPIVAVYHQNGVKAATLTCFDEDQERSCNGKKKRVKIGAVSACYSAPDSDGGSMVTWFDGKLDCALMFTEPMFDRKGAKQEQQAAVSFAAEALEKISKAR